jgi:hypothetical protein
MNSTLALPRRRFLRGLGLSIALPALESLMPAARALAAATPKLARTHAGNPLRMAFVYIPNGVNVARWRPSGEGADYQLGETMQPLEGLKPHFSVFTGFEQQNGWGRQDGAGDHARAIATILTGARPKKTAGSDIRLGVSVDQFAARHVGSATRFPSLELSCDGARKSGACDSGYSCAYQFNISWRSETTPVAPESNPRLVFERLFGAGKGAERQRSLAMRQAQQKSILDFVHADATALSRQLGRNDQHKLDEYLTGVREIEQRIAQTERFGPLPDPGVEAPDAEIPGDYEKHIRLMMDMLVLAFRTDSTRISTFILAHDGSNRSFREIGVSDGHHSISHHQNDPDKLDRLGKIDLFYTKQLAYLLEKMRAIKEANGTTLLDNSMLVYCSGLSDGNRHNHSDLPVILAGKAGGAYRPGRHVKLGDTAMTNLYVRMLQTMGVKTDRFGDSTGVLREA